MKFVLCRSHTISSWLIQTASWSEWSHVAVMIDAETIIDATFKHGVAKRPLSELLADDPIFTIVDLPVPNEAAAIRAAHSQIGKKYDWKGVAGFPFHRDWADEGQWWCSEFAAWVALRGGATWYRFSVLTRISPQHIWMVGPSGSRYSAAASTY